MHKPKTVKKSTGHYTVKNANSNSRQHRQEPQHPCFALKKLLGSKTVDGRTLRPAPKMGQRGMEPGWWPQDPCIPAACSALVP